MSANLPEPLKVLVEQLAKLPGLGSKSALRLAMTLLKWPEAETRRLGGSISSLRDNLCLCSRCGGLSALDPCPICADPGRSRETLCVVSEWDSMLAMEAGGFFQGQYMILGGVLEPLQQKDSQSLETERLLRRLGEGEISEVVLALGATLEAENTVSFLKELIKRHYPDIKISRLAQGLPLGAEVKFMDHETLRQSMKYRQNI